MYDGPAATAWGRTHDLSAGLPTAGHHTHGIALAPRLAFALELLALPRKP